MENATMCYSSLKRILINKWSWFCENKWKTKPQDIHGVTLKRVEAEN